MKNLAINFCARALSNSADIPSALRADLYDYAADLLDNAKLHAESEAARATALDLRNAEAAQARFEALLSAARELNSVQ